MIKTFLILGCIVSSSIAFSQTKLKMDEVKAKYSIVEGEYKLISGAKSDCIVGEYRLTKGNDGIVSLWSASGLIAKNLQSEVANYREKKCSINYTTTPMLSGFKNTESVHCEDAKTSYTRTLITKFENKKLKYKLSSHRIIENKKSEVTCLLELVDKK